MQSLISSVLSGFHSFNPSSSSTKNASAIAPPPRASDAIRRSEKSTFDSDLRDLITLRQEVLEQHAAAVSLPPSYSVTPKPRLSVSDIASCEPSMAAFEQAISIQSHHHSQFPTDFPLTLL
jgi:hypothetical protein